VKHFGIAFIILDFCQRNTKFLRKSKKRDTVAEYIMWWTKRTYNLCPFPCYNWAKYSKQFLSKSWQVYLGKNGIGEHLENWLYNVYGYTDFKSNYENH
jgi:hypothetical protein